MSDLMEQLDACYDIAHKYKCAICGERQGHTPFVVTSDTPDRARVTVITACVDCLPKVKSIAYKEG